MEDLFSWGEEGPVEFLTRIKEHTGWTIKHLKYGQYTFNEDPLGLVFWWDDLFGFTITVPDWDRLQDALDFLKPFLNDGV